MAGLVDRFPFPLSGRTAATSASFALEGVQYDVAIGGMPFLLKIDDDHAMTRAGAQLRKEQFDNQKEPGEQSLANWWHRSQATFIGGQGLLYQDPDQVQVANLQNRHAIQYGASVGVNPWTNGSLTLLKQTDLRISDGSANAHYVVGYTASGTDKYWSAVGNVLKSDDGTTATAVTWGGANTIRSLATDGTNYFAADNVNVYKGAGAGAGAAWSATGTTNTVVRWAKGRIMLGLDNKIYETTSAGAQTLRFTHLNAAWVWTDIAEGTNAIFASGYAGSQSDIYKFVLDTSGNVPTLAAGGIQAAQLPRGEVVYALTTYLGTFVGIGTNRGFRVGQINDNGDIEYGPLLITNSSGVKSIAAYDRYFFVAGTNSIDGTSGLWRVDLGQPVQDAGSSPGIRFACATDLQAKVTGEVASVTNFGGSGRMVFTVTGQGSYLESATVLESTGYLKTGRVRYNTLEPKIFKIISVKTPSSLWGSVGVSVIDPGGADTSIITVSQGSSLSIQDVILAAPATAVEWIQLKLTLGRSGTDTTRGGEVNGWQLKAMPGATRQRVFTLPLLCFDREKDRAGQTIGSEGRSLARLEAFEQIFARGDAITYQDLRSGRSYLVVIDDYRYEQKSAMANNQSKYGGILWVELRTIADVVTS